MNYCRYFIVCVLFVITTYVVSNDIIIHKKLQNGIPSFTCPPYTAAKTSNDLQKYTTCSYTLNQIGVAKAYVKGTNLFLLNIIILIQTIYSVIMCFVSR